MIIAQFTIPMVAVAKSRARITKTGHSYTPKKTRDWERSIAILARQCYSGAPIDQPLSVSLVFVLPRPKRLAKKRDKDGLIPMDKKPDIDNLIKAILDGVSQSGIWVDDSRVCQLRASKFYAEKDGLPRVDVLIDTEITNQPKG